MGIFGIIFIAILGIVSNTGTTSADNVEDQMFLMGCPMPLWSTFPNNTSIEGFAVTYDTIRNDTFANNIYVFDCFIDPVSDNRGLTVTAYLSSSGFFANFSNLFATLGFLYFAFQTAFANAIAMFTLITFYLTPINFDILGFTIADIGGQGLALVVFIYAICYISIGLMIYKLVNPLGSGT